MALYHILEIGNIEMLTELKACYSPQDLIFIVSLFILTIISVSAFIVLLIHAFRGAISEVRNIKAHKQES